VNAIKNVISIVVANETEIVAFISKIGIDPNFIEGLIDEVLAWASKNISTIAGTTVSTAINMVSSVTSFVLALILAIYILLDKRRLSNRVQRLLRALLPERIS